MPTVAATGQITIVDLTDSPNLILSSYSYTAPADGVGVVVQGGLAGAQSVAKVIVGNLDDSATWTFSKIDTSCVSSILSGVVTVSAISADTAFIDITASKAGYPSLTARFSLSKARQGVAGVAGVSGVGGTRGSINLSRAITGTVWTDAEAIAALNSAGLSSTPVSGDIITLYNLSSTPKFTETRTFLTGIWQILAAYFNGALIVEGTIKGTALEVGAVTADKIDAQAITAKHLLVADLTNLCYNGNGENLDGWYASTGLSFTYNTATFWPSLTASKSSLNAWSRDNYFGPSFSCLGGDPFYTELYSIPFGGGAGKYVLNFGLQFFAPDGAALGWFVGATRPIGQTDVQFSSGPLVAPAGAGSARVWLQVDKPVGTLTSGQGDGFHVTKLLIRRRSTGKLIVDGAISADKIEAGAITADKIDAKAITTDKLDVGAVTADKIAVGAITADAIDTKGLVISDPQGNPVFSYNIPLSAPHIVPDPGWVNANVNAVRNVLSGQGGFAAGTINWNSQGVVTGGQGVAYTANGFVATNEQGALTFVLDATTGDARFSGDISGARGEFSGTLRAGVLKAQNLFGTTVEKSGPGVFDIPVPPLTSPGATMKCRYTLVGAGGGGSGAGVQDNSYSGGGGGSGGFVSGIIEFPALSETSLATNGFVRVNLGAGGAGGPPKNSGGNGAGSQLFEISPATGSVAQSRNSAGGGGGSPVGNDAPTAGAGGGAGSPGGMAGANGQSSFANGNDGVNMFGGRGGRVPGISTSFGGVGGSNPSAGGDGVQGGGGGGGGQFDNPGSGTGGAGGAGYVRLEFYDGTNVVLKEEYELLISALVRQGISPT